jgi:hypothetical protein
MVGELLWEKGFGVEGVLVGFNLFGAGWEAIESED